MMRWNLLGLIALSAFGCTIVQSVEPVPGPVATEVCVVENSAVRPGFLREYLSNLTALGYQTRTLPQGSPLTNCTITSTYDARWSYEWFWTSGVYLSVAEINVYREGLLAGRAVFDTTGGQASLKRIVDAEPKIRELVIELFPPAPR